MRHRARCQLMSYLVTMVLVAQPLLVGAFMPGAITEMRRRRITPPTRSRAVEPPGSVSSAAQPMDAANASSKASGFRRDFGKKRRRLINALKYDDRDIWVRHAIAQLRLHHASSAASAAAAGVANWSATPPPQDYSSMLSAARRIRDPAVLISLLRAIPASGLPLNRFSMVTTICGLHEAGVTPLALRLFRQGVALGHFDAIALRRSTPALWSPAPGAPAPPPPPPPAPSGEGPAAKLVWEWELDVRNLQPTLAQVATLWMLEEVGHLRGGAFPFQREWDGWGVMVAVVVVVSLARSLAGRGRTTVVVDSSVAGVGEQRT